MERKRERSWRAGGNERRSDKRLEGKAGGIGNSLCDGEGVEARKRNDTYAFFLVCPWHKASDHLERGLRFRGDILLVRRRRGYLLDCHYRMIYTFLGYGCGKSSVKGNFGSEGKEHVKTCPALRRVIGDMAMETMGMPYSSDARGCPNQGLHMATP